MKPRLAMEVDLPEGTLELYVSSQKAPGHAWMRTGERPKLTWKYDSRQISHEEAAGLLLQRAKAQIMAEEKYG